MNTILVFDFETTGKDPHVCHPVQVAAMPIHSKTLEPVQDKFCSLMKPPDIDKIDNEVVEWHAKVKDCTTKEILQSWANAPDAKTVWIQFCNYVNKFNWKNTKFTAPIAAGHNILRYDLVIVERLVESYGMGKNKYLFHPRDWIDTMNLCFLWLESVPEVRGYSMDYLRDYFGLSAEGSHDALTDVVQCGQIVSRFLKWHRAMASRTEFAKSFALSGE